MPVNPTPPTDFAAVLEAWEQTARAVHELAITTSPTDADLPTQCPGWTVRDQVSHVASVEAMLAGVTQPRVELPELAHVVTKMDRTIERPIHARRGLPLEEIATELDWIVRSRSATFRDPGLDATTPVPGPFGMAPAIEVLRFRLVDIWCHEQDIRQALGRPGDLDSPAASVFVERIVAELPKVIARHTSIPVGDQVIIECTGPVITRTGVRITEVDGARRGEPLFTGETTDSVGATTTISLSTDALTRRAAGRITAEETPHTGHGDPAVIAEVLEALRIIDF